MFKNIRLGVKSYLIVCQFCSILDFLLGRRRYYFKLSFFGLSQKLLGSDLKGRRSLILYLGYLQQRTQMMKPHFLAGHLIREGFYLWQSRGSPLSHWDRYLRPSWEVSHGGQSPPSGSTGSERSSAIFRRWKILFCFENVGSAWEMSFFICEKDSSVASFRKGLMLF